MVFEISGITLPVWLPLLWGVLGGVVFSMVGAAGGILASVGLISVMGIQDPNLVKSMAQALTLVTPLVAVPGYYRQRRVVVSLAAILGVGGIIGAIIGSTLSVTYLADLKIFKPVLAVLVVGIALQIAWQLFSSKRYVETRAKRAAVTFEEHVRHGGLPRAIGVKHLRFSPHQISFAFSGQEFAC